MTCVLLVEAHLLAKPINWRRWDASQTVYKSLKQSKQISIDGTWLQ